MEFGVHLPQYGRAAGPDAIARAARQAEELGYRDVWVSDHLAVPVDQAYPPAFLLEPLIALTWAAAATSTVRLATSVLVLPYRHPLLLAKELASLDVLAGGRLLVGAAAGWLEGEFDALGVPFTERGRRTDEALDVLRACWGPDPVTTSGAFYAMQDMKVVPKPSQPSVPVWVGGTSAAALHRATVKGDGWHGNFLSAEDAELLVEQLREARPEPSFTLSMRLRPMEADEVHRCIDGYDAIGVQHLLLSPTAGDVDGWLHQVESYWEAAHRPGVL